MDTPLALLLVEASERALDVALRELDGAGYSGLSPSHALAVQLVERGIATTRDLAVAMRMTPQAVSAIVARLEAGGFVARRREARDARTKLITLTREGHRVAAAIAGALLAVEEDWAEVVGPERVDLLRTTLHSYLAGGPTDRDVGEQPRRRRVRIS